MVYEKSSRDKMVINHKHESEQFCFVVWPEIKPRALYMLDKYSVTELDTPVRVGGLKATDFNSERL